MVNKGNQYDDEFRADAMRLVKKGGRSLGKLGIDVRDALLVIVKMAIIST